MFDKIRALFNGSKTRRFAKKTKAELFSSRRVFRRRPCAGKK